MIFIQHFATIRQYLSFHVIGRFKSKRTQQRHRKKIISQLLNPVNRNAQSEIPLIVHAQLENVNNNDSSNVTDCAYVGARCNFEPICTDVVNVPQHQNSFEHDFVKVAVKQGIGRNGLNEFLSIFRKHGVGNFPKDARTCVGSLRRVDSNSMCGGRYFHFGLSNTLNMALKNVS